MYPHLPLDAAIKAAESRVRRMHHDNIRLLDDLEHDIQHAIGRTGSGPNIDMVPLEQVRYKVEARAGLSRNNERAASADQFSTDNFGKDKDRTEGVASTHLFGAVDRCGAEPTALDDPGFWRYVAMAHLWNFAAWRETKAFTASASDDGAIIVPRNLKDYVDGTKSHECVPLRMFLRVRCLGGALYADRASAVREGTDFWRSHILRVVAGEHPPVVRAMVRRQSDPKTRLNTDRVREFAKQLNRTLVNVVPAMLDDYAAEELVGELWQRQLS